MEQSLQARLAESGHRLIVRGKALFCLLCRRRTTRGLARYYDEVVDAAEVPYEDPDQAGVMLFAKLVELAKRGR